MKVAVSAESPSLDAPVDPRFGRCAYLVIIDTETMDFEAVHNGNVNLGSGAGIQTAQDAAGKGAVYVLTGRCGPKAFQVLTAAGVSVITDCTGTVREAVEAFKNGNYTQAAEPNAQSHSGMTQSAPASAQVQQNVSPFPGGGMGMGMGRGRGCGRGGGRGGGMGMGKGQCGYGRQGGGGQRQ